jgi:pimeloyl-ACP methyl ester carboxylesterase
LLLAAHKYPALWSSLIPLDPLFSPYLFEDADRVAALKPVIANTIRRRDFWKTREEAFLSFSANPFFAVWHPSALHSFVTHALYDDPVTGGVRLKMPPVQEGVVYECRAYAEIWQLLPTLDSRVDLFWIMAGVKAWFPRPDGVDQTLVWRRPQNARNIIIGCGHGVPLERPKELADELAAFLQRKFGFQVVTDSVQARL